MQVMARTTRTKSTTTKPARRFAHSTSWRVVALTAMFVCAPAFGNDEPVAPAAVPAAPIGVTEAAQKSAYQNKQICHMEPVAGSHIKKRICRTQAEADEERASAQSSMDNLNSAKGGIRVNGG